MRGCAIERCGRSRAILSSRDVRLFCAIALGVALLLARMAACVGRQVVEQHADALRLGIMDVDEFHALWTRGKGVPLFTLHYL